MIDKSRKKCREEDTGFGSGECCRIDKSRKKCRKEDAGRDTEKK